MTLATNLELTGDDRAVPLLLQSPMVVAVEGWGSRLSCAVLFAGSFFNNDTSFLSYTTHDLY